MSVQIIAEIGASHGGSVDEAVRLAALAAGCGVDVIKGQAGISKLTAKGHPLHGRFAELELSQSEWGRVAKECRNLGVGFALSVWSNDAAERSTCLTDAFIKVGSGDATHRPTLEAAKASGLPVYLSTGLCTEGEIRTSIDILGDALACLLACTVDYPASVDQSNLARLIRLERMCPRHPVKIGYSSHCLDWRVPYLAAEFGADVIEVHFGDEKTDDAAALTPDDLSRLVNAIRSGDAPEMSYKFTGDAVGAGHLGVRECEEKWLPLARRDPATGLRR